MPRDPADLPEIQDAITRLSVMVDDYADSAVPIETAPIRHLAETIRHELDPLAIAAPSAAIAFFYRVLRELPDLVSEALEDPDAQPNVPLPDAQEMRMVAT